MLAVVLVDLEALFSLEPGHTYALERFMGDCLFEAGIWDSPRASDGISGIERVLERRPERLKLYGRIFNIDQTLHTFWLELEREHTGDHVAWFIYFDVAESSQRRVRNALSTCDRPDDIEWRVRLAGEAAIREGTLAIVSGSTRLLVRDMPDPEPPQTRRSRGRS